MSSGFFTHAIIRILDAIAVKVLAPTTCPEHQRTGRGGEEDAYFYLRKLGYVMVARNYRSPRRHGEIDLIGWHKNVLCFIEVKTRTTRDVKPAEAAVGPEKQRDLLYVAREYLRRLPPSCQWRFDVLTVYYDRHSSQPQFELFQNAFQVS
jgi:putative endonuclease